jgi:hypothetical protein
VQPGRSPRRETKINRLRFLRVALRPEAPRLSATHSFRRLTNEEAGITPGFSVHPVLPLLGFASIGARTAPDPNYTRYSPDRKYNAVRKRGDHSRTTVDGHQIRTLPQPQPVPSTLLVEMSTHLGLPRRRRDKPPANMPNRKLRS